MRFGVKNGPVVNTKLTLSRLVIIVWGGLVLSIGITEVTVVFSVCIATAIFFVLIFLWVQRRGARSGGKGSEQILIRFARNRVVDAHPEVLQILEMRGWDGTAPSLQRFFAFRFRGLPPSLIVGSAPSTQTYPARDTTDRAALKVTQDGQVVTVILSQPDDDADVAGHFMKYRRHEQWLSDWLARSSHNPVWVTDDEGKVFWSNRSYQQLASAYGPNATEGRSITDGLDPARSMPDREQRRFKLTFDTGQPDRWIDVDDTSENGMRLHHAIDVTAVVQAEQAQRSFVQTLTKTFAQLSTGLAIFDRSRQLALFNPALVDLTGLSAEYLAQRPGYLSFFDKLREGQIMPEPRNYSNWRDGILDVIAAAEDGRYQETWALGNGRTYRVTGRPHPNGAVAFIIEDISGEVTLTRRFREQLDMSNAVIETLEDAVAVFSPQGTLSYTNSAYRRLWQLEDGQTAVGLSVSDISRRWQEHCEPSPIWGDFRDFVVGIEGRADWSATAHMTDGRILDCRFSPLGGGATLVRFSVAAGISGAHLRAMV